jgi:Ni/Fe-hydrogenase subunit HybB-like protein
MQTTKDIDIRPSSVALWSGVFAGPFAWALVFELKYALIEYACRNHAPWLFWIFFLLGILICAYGAFSGWRGKAADASTRAQFMGIAGVALSIAFSVFIIAMSIPDLFLRPCE